LIASFDNEVFYWIFRTGCGLVLAERFWFDERLMSANCPTLTKHLIRASILLLSRLRTRPFLLGISATGHPEMRPGLSSAACDREDC
jgi:hypothetical protein